ncbi:MAG: hypothetical protein JOZ83_17875 [Silvibacterium sp.]|nr:hypothetical protein [Silvibacterium sp.]
MAPDGGLAYVSNFGLLEANHKVGTAGTTISVLDLEKLTERARFKLPDGYTAPHGLKLRPSKFNELFTNTEEGKEGMVVFDTASGAVLRTFALPPGVHNFVFDADGSHLFAFTMTEKVCRIDAESGHVETCTEAGSPRGIGWTADGRYVMVSGKNEIRLLDPVRLSTVRQIGKLDLGQVFYTAATADGRWFLAPAVLDRVLLAIDPKSGEVKHRVETGSPLMVGLDPDRKHAWISNVRTAGVLAEGKAREGGVSLLDLSTFTFTPVPGLVDANGIAVSSK